MNDTDQPVPPEPSRHRWPMWTAGGVALVVLLGLGWWWSAADEYPRRAMSTLVEQGEPVGSTATDFPPVVNGDLVYLGAVDRDSVTVVAVDVTTGDQRWESVVEDVPGTNRGLVAERGFLYLYNDLVGVQLLAADTGEILGRIPAGDPTAVRFVGEALVVRDAGAGTLTGYDRRGETLWSVAAPDVGTSWGEATGWDQFTEPRQLDEEIDPDALLWSIADDGTARVRDANDGTVTAERKLAPGHAPVALADEGRLVVAAGNLDAAGDAAPGYTVTAYDLDELLTLGSWTTGTAVGRFPVALTVCGEEVACLTATGPDTTDFAPRYLQAFRCDDAPEPLWDTEDTAQIGAVEPVGDTVAVEIRTDGVDSAVTRLYRTDDGEVIGDRPGRFRPVDSGSLLSHPAGTGMSISEATDWTFEGLTADGTVHQLGTASVRDCVATDTRLLCLVADGYRIWRYRD